MLKGTGRNSGPRRILLIEDSTADIELMQEAFSEAEGDVLLTSVRNGDEALPHLRRSLGEGGDGRPDLIMLDLNLPRRDGREILEELKRDERLRLIPVVVLTTSGTEDDVTRCYSLGANCYIRKPFEYSQFRDLARSIVSFWFSFARLPGAV